MKILNNKRNNIKKTKVIKRKIAFFGVIHLLFSYTRFDYTSDHCLLTQTSYTSYKCSFLIGGFQIPYFIPLNHLNKILHGQPVEPTLPFFQRYPPPLLSLTCSPGSPSTHSPTSFGLHLACISVSFHSPPKLF